MKNLNLIAKISGLLSVLLGSLWLGAYLLRLFITYQLFEGADLSFKSFVNEGNLHGIYVMLLPAVTTTFILFILFILSFLLFLLSSKLNLRKNGWLFIITVVIIICIPFEIYLMSIDYPLIVLLNSEKFINESVTELILRRFKALGSFPLIEIFCFISLYYFMLFKPFRKD